MKILNATQIREADAYTIENEPIASIDLMERAADQCVIWLNHAMDKGQRIGVLAGMGNNGGDGLSIARRLKIDGYSVVTYIVKLNETGSPDFEKNHINLMAKGGNIVYIEKNDAIDFSRYDVVIDALFGSGLSRPIDGVAGAIVTALNHSSAHVISIDLPSGMQCENTVVTSESVIVKANDTLCFETPKLDLLLPSYAEYTGNLHILPIGLDQEFIRKQESTYYYTDLNLVRSILRRRKPHTHKGTYGHATIVAGSRGKMGAAVLATKACLHSGTGLVTAHIPHCGYAIMQISVPEAMIEDNEGINTLEISELTANDHIGLGPGIGTSEGTTEFVKEILAHNNASIVIDADALNILAQHPELKPLIPNDSILTPHPREFERLVGTWNTEAEKLDKLLQLAKGYSSTVVLKGQYTAIASPEGTIYFNSTGNPGMATAGSGDVLTGILTGLLTQGYSGIEAGILGVYLHGLAGDYAAYDLGEEAMTASSIINQLGEAFKHLHNQ